MADKKGKNVIPADEAEREVVTMEDKKGKKVIVADEAEKEVLDAGEKGKKVILRTNDNQEFEVDESLAIESGTIKFLIQDGCAEQAVPLANVNSSTLVKILDYWATHKSANKDNADEVKEWDKEFVKMGKEDLFELISAANYLDAKQLSELLFETVAKHIEKMTVEEVREYFSIENDFSPEEEQEIRKEVEWAFS
ncbi:SKP1-like protein 1B [Iris pallida]|uniref:SKP1-like protein n=1 Tax=Iris pallida TaxID=29817 RepID=A0AAX6EBX6_IRIPA|nr:SKP1-like protein 1B [Iris pallida]